MSKGPEVRRSKDGSTTLYSPQFDQLYHNPNGAWSESRHVFFDLPGLSDDIRSGKALNIIEVGFGSGLNFILLADLMKQFAHVQPVHYYSVEAYPLGKEAAEGIDLSDHLMHPELNELLPGLFESIQAGMNNLQPVESLDLHLHLYSGFFSDWPLSGLKADYIFQDAFSPQANPELWTTQVFEKLIGNAAPGAILSTYCAASKARAAMAAAGWKVAREQGALGKREMTLASPSASALEGKKRVNEKRLIERLHSGDFD